MNFFSMNDIDDSFRNTIYQFNRLLVGEKIAEETSHNARHRCYANKFSHLKTYAENQFSDFLQLLLNDKQ